MGQAGCPNGSPCLATVAGEKRAPFKNEPRAAGVLDGGAHQQHGVGDEAGGVLHLPGVGAVHNCGERSTRRHSDTTGHQNLWGDLKSVLRQSFALRGHRSGGRRNKF